MLGATAMALFCAFCQCSGSEFWGRECYLLRDGRRGDSWALKRWIFISPEQRHVCQAVLSTGRNRPPLHVVRQDHGRPGP
jgi:hypothetical protein